MKGLIWSIGFAKINKFQWNSVEPGIFGCDHECGMSYFLIQDGESNMTIFPISSNSMIVKKIVHHILLQFWKYHSKFAISDQKCHGVLKFV